jgi:hypothetical protein
MLMVRKSLEKIELQKQQVKYAANANLMLPLSMPIGAKPL